jgi:hypothetical protein
MMFIQNFSADTSEYFTEEMSCSIDGRETNQKENVSIQPKKTMKFRAPKVKAKGPIYSSKGWNTLSMA